MSRTIEETAMRWAEVKIRHKSLLAKRASFECDREKAATGLDDVTPCWKMVSSEDGYGQVERYGDGSPEGWCEPCSQRQEVHAELAKVSPLLSGRAAALFRVCKSALEAPDAR